MYDFDRTFKEVRRQAQRLRAEMTWRRARAQLVDLGRELDELRNDMARSGYAREARRLREHATDLLPMVERRRQPQPWMLAIPAAAVLLTAAAAALFWDGSRRLAAQRRLGTAVRGLDQGLKRAVRLPSAHEEAAPAAPPPAPMAAPAAGSQISKASTTATNRQS